MLLAPIEGALPHRWSLKNWFPVALPLLALLVPGATGRTGLDQRIAVGLAGADAAVAAAALATANGAADARIALLRLLLCDSGQRYADRKYDADRESLHAHFPRL